MDFRVSIDLATGIWDYPLVLEVLGQGVIVSREGARATDNCQRQDVVVVGHAPVRAA